MEKSLFKKVYLIENPVILLHPPSIHIIYPRSFVGDEQKRKAIRDTIDLAEQTNEEKSAFFIYKCVTAFTDKVIDEDTAQKIRRRIGMMTKVERIIEQEKIDAVNAAVSAAVSCKLDLSKSKATFVTV